MTKIILKESTLKIPTTTQMKKEETPTVINIDIDNDNEQGENDKYQLPPSSPPPALYSDAPLVSEFDFTTNIEYNFGVPKSPPKKVDLNLLPSEFDEFNPIATTNNNETIMTTPRMLETKIVL